MDCARLFLPSGNPALMRASIRLPLSKPSPRSFFVAAPGMPLAWALPHICRPMTRAATIAAAHLLRRPEPATQFIIRYRAPLNGPALRTLFRNVRIEELPLESGDLPCHYRHWSPRRTPQYPVRSHARRMAGLASQQPCLARARSPWRIAPRSGGGSQEHGQRMAANSAPGVCREPANRRSPDTVHPSRRRCDRGPASPAGGFRQGRCRIAQTRQPDLAAIGWHVRGSRHCPEG